MTLSDSDKEFINAIQTAHYAKIDSTLTILTAKLDTHIEIESKKDEDGSYSYTDLKDMNKKQQIVILKELRLDSKEIKDLKKEQDRIDKILELQK